MPLTVARAVLFNDAALTPVGAPKVGVIALAKRDLKAGQTLDGIGGFDTYGVAENAPVVHRDRLLPMGLAEGCRVKRDMAKDTALTFDDVIIPPGRKIDAYYAEMERHFGLVHADAAV